MKLNERVVLYDCDYEFRYVTIIKKIGSCHENL